MAVRFKYSRDFIVGGPGTAPLTPSFQLREYARPDGTVLIHRELVGSVQVLRDAVGMPLKVVSVAAADGLGAGRGQGRLDPGRIGHQRLPISAPGLNRASGRTS